MSPYHIEAGQLICNANLLAGFYMIGNIGRRWVKLRYEFQSLLELSFEKNFRQRFQINFVFQVKIGSELKPFFTRKSKTFIVVLRKVLNLF